MRQKDNTETHTRQSWRKQYHWWTDLLSRMNRTTLKQISKSIVNMQSGLKWLRIMSSGKDLVLEILKCLVLLPARGEKHFTWTKQIGIIAKH